MSLFYGLCAGFVVCLPSWLVLRYISLEAGMLVGLFLATLLLVMTIYANSDEHSERHHGVVESVSNTERVLLDAIRWIEMKIDTLPESLVPSQSSPPSLDKSLEMLNRILDDSATDGRGEVPPPGVTA